MANIVTTNRPTICKGEFCLSCLLKSEAVELAEGVAIICSLELKPEGVNELDGVDCPSWKLDPDADVVYDEDDSEDKEESETPEEDSVELVQPYEFVSDSLVLVKDTTLPHNTIPLTTSFVEAYNAMVQLTKFRVQQKIDVLNGKLAELLLKAKEKVQAGGIDQDDAIGLIEDFNTFTLEEQSTDNIIDAAFNELDDMDMPDFDDETLDEFEDELENDEEDEEEFEGLDEDED